MLSIDSRPGELSLLEWNQARGGRTGATAAPPSSQHDAEGLRFDWTVRWPPHGGVLAKYPVHWTPTQSALPVVSFEVFRGQVRHILDCKGHSMEPFLLYYLNAEHESDLSLSVRGVLLVRKVPALKLLSSVACPHRGIRPTAYLVRRLQILAARSMLEIPPIIKHQDGHLAFLHPCHRAGPPNAGTFKPSNSENSDANVFLDVRCSFKTSGGKRKRQHPEVGIPLAIASGVPRSPSEAQLLQGGVLCIQVRGRRIYKITRCHPARIASYLI